MWSLHLILWVWINSAHLVCCYSTTLTRNLVETMTDETPEVITDSMLQTTLMCYCATAPFGSSSSASQQWQIIPFQPSQPLHMTVCVWRAHGKSSGYLCVTSQSVSISHQICWRSAKYQGKLHFPLSQILSFHIKRQHDLSRVSLWLIV